MSAQQPLYREFILSSGDAAGALVRLIKANGSAFAAAGTPLRVLVTSEEQKRNSDSNRYYWGCVLRCISEQAWVDGKQFDKDVWHEYYARKFGICEEVTLPNGELVTRRKSTADMTVGEFSTYINQVQANAASELGVEFA